MLNHDFFDRPRTGPESVPLPPSRCSDAAWLEYLLEVRRAEANETGDQATDRCRAEAARYDRQAMFDATLAELLRVYDTTAADQRYSGMTLDEAGFFDEYLLADLAKHWKAMQMAFRAGDRQTYRREAAKFTGRAACFAAGLDQ